MRANRLARICYVPFKVRRYYAKLNVTDRLENRTNQRLSYVKDKTEKRFLNEVRPGGNNVLRKSRINDINTFDAIAQINYR